MKIGIDLGGSHIAIGVINNEGFIVEKVEKRLLTKEKKDIKAAIESYIVKNVKEELHFSSYYIDPMRILAARVITYSGREVKPEYR